ncbi:MAG TPA: DUF2203 domain-containing protein [Ignavibacteria bacterium]|nr:DUF2203 domain-containing protein [Ignavibacteria bacterium]
MFHKRHFNLEEARSMLPEIKSKISLIAELKESLDERNYDINKHQYFGGFGPNGTGKFPEEMEKLVLLVNELTEKGVLIKDLNSGLIDFPHIRDNGEEVYLCFLLGEEDIKFWHSIEDGFAGRKEI